MFAKLSSFVGGGISLPFDLGEPHTSAWGQWTHYQGTLKADGSPVSVFRISAMNKEDPKLGSARNGVKRLRTVSKYIKFSNMFVSCGISTTAPLKF